VEHGARVSDKTVRATAGSVILKKHIGYVSGVVTHDKNFCLKIGVL
jgi:hypothetical protein